jgi:hypothetical protein
VSDPAAGFPSPLLFSSRPHRFANRCRVFKATGAIAFDYRSAHSSPFAASAASSMAELDLY